MANFSRLRLQGFKSFVDKTDLDIAPGMTGIVGPNGCGKSNLVEALSWVMGETSAKRLRGSGMDDVIFNGTSTRPQRNSAEVSVVLDNTDRTAPAMFNNTDEIEVVRRIERDMGSSYYVNSKPVRARDVQMLFADLAIGAHSTAIVSQGRIAAIINAKPAERRQILEESAGVSGLYVRRHEAELRLRAADNNLARLQDVLSNLETQLDALKRQSRQARRYKEVSESIRNLETILALAEWTHAQESQAKSQAALLETETLVAEKTATIAQLTRLQLEQADAVPPLREKQAETAAAWQAQNFELRRIEDEENRITAQINEATKGLEQVSTDRVHEQETSDENALVLVRLEREEADLRAQAGNEMQLKTLTSLKDDAAARVEKFQGEYQESFEQSANSRASRNTLQSQLSKDEQHLQNIQNRLDNLRQQIESKKAARGDFVSTEEMSAEIEQLQIDLNSQRQSEQSIRENIDALQSELDAQRPALQKAQEVLQKTKAEISALESVLNAETQQGFRPVLEDIKADEGFEAALAKALGDTLMASTQSDAPMMWSPRSTIEAPSFPSGVQALLPKIRAPEALKTALSFIGYVETAEEGDAAASQLKAGQSIVSRDGAYWRWDGLTILAKAVDRNAIRLKNKNRLEELQATLPAQETEFENAQKALDKAREDLNNIRATLQPQEQKTRETERNLNNKRNELQRTIEKQSQSEQELLKLEEALIILQDDAARLTATVGSHQSSLQAFDDAALERLTEEVERKRQALQGAQDEYRQASTDLEVYQQDQQRRSGRLHAIADERINLTNRSIRAKERIKQLEDREIELTAKLDELKTRPEELIQARINLLDNLATLENAKNAAADKLAEAEKELHGTNQSLKEAEAANMQVREDRARIQATLEAATGSIDIIRQSIQDQFACEPDELWEKSEMTTEKMTAEPIDRLRGKRDRLIRERDGMGPVNLRADVESQEVEQQLATLIQERNDLTQAIDELRQGIQKLNKEARERLVNAFNTVNEHFKVLFTQLFGGGAAHLAFIESDDPLEAALEIFAQPPGKSLQSLSLLSGGEKTLASTALLFAMFMTNPAPICVLDEIDAPLDDANVDRVCTALEQMAATGKTRFIVITHHRMTMARMNRLYGVTMSERGVSQLVSVDLQHKFDFLEAAE